MARAARPSSMVRASEDAANFRLLDEPAGEAARQQVGDGARKDRDHALLRFVVRPRSVPGLSILAALADLLPPIVAVEVLELGAKNGPVVEACVAIYAEEDLFGASRVQVVLHHEIQKLSEAFSDLIDKLREGDAARDQTLASLARVQLTEATIGVPDDDSGGDVPDLHSLLRHEGPFLAPLWGRSPSLLIPLRPPTSGSATVREVYVQQRAL